MSFMFNECYKLKEIKGLNNFNTNNVTNMKAMFQLCNEIISLDIYNFNTLNVSDMSYMFNKCEKLKEIKGINNFITNNVTNMEAIFKLRYELIYLDLSNFNTSKVIDISFMLYDCKKLEYLNITNFQIINNCETKNIFKYFTKRMQFNCY